MLKTMFKGCEICKKPRLWFLIKQRSMKPNSFMPVIKSQKKMCGRCFKNVNKYFVNGPAVGGELDIKNMISLWDKLPKMNSRLESFYKNWIIGKSSKQG